VTPHDLLDTNIIIHIRRSRPPAVQARFRALQHGDAAMSVVTYGELQFGVAKSQDPGAAAQTLEELVTLVPVLTLSASAGDTYGVLRATLQRRGELIGNNDLWIAAHALAEGLTLVTNHERDDPGASIARSTPATSSTEADLRSSRRHESQRLRGGRVRPAPGFDEAP
jgi:tRNA(fMet)-specific endonuclease VapC